VRYGACGRARFLVMSWNQGREPTLDGIEGRDTLYPAGLLVSHHWGLASDGFSLRS
jgi:hypothetical protein